MPASSVLVIGGGAFGTSTAYHLAHRGYTNVTVLDRFETPSKDAASTDLNKIIRYDYTNPIYTRLALEAMGAWKQGIFAGMFRPTGWILAAHDMTREFVESVYETSQQAGRKEARFMSTQDTKLKWPEFTGPLEGWINLWSPEAGWVS
jgi:sarcosine oxidase/L-pipecolate oxidase